MSDLPPGSPAGAGLRRWRRRSRLSRLIGTVAAAVLVVLLGDFAVSFLQIGSDANPSSGSGSPSGSPSAAATSASPRARAGGRPTVSGPSATPRPRSDAAEPNRSLTKNSLYGVDLDGMRVS
ncbi:MAG TPA: hypothetical protein VGW74_16195, partial [Propionibacteriaceae bacterium]|nr:hypothetical protein [Propionibacteriaceae bacterium]